MLIKLDDAIRVVQDNLAFSVKANIIADLRALPVSDGWEDIMTEEMIDAGIKAYLLWRDGSDWQCETLVKAVHQAMLEAALGPLPAPPTIE